MWMQFNSIFTLIFKLLQIRGQSSDLTAWKTISKQVRKLTPNRVTVANKVTFLERNRQLWNYIILEIKTVVFSFISKYYSKLSLNHIQLRACRHSRSCCCSVSADRQARATTSPAYKWSGSVYFNCAGVLFLFSVLLLQSVYHYQNNNVSVVLLISLYI